MAGWQEHIEAAERELGWDDAYSYDKDFNPDSQLAAAHALVAMAKLLEYRNIP